MRGRGRGRGLAAAAAARGVGIRPEASWWRAGRVPRAAPGWGWLQRGDSWPLGAGGAGGAQRLRCKMFIPLAGFHGVDVELG